MRSSSSFSSSSSDVLSEKPTTRGVAFIKPTISTSSSRTSSVFDKIFTHIFLVTLAIALLSVVVVTAVDDGVDDQKNDLIPAAAGASTSQTLIHLRDRVNNVVHRRRRHRSTGTEGRGVASVVVRPATTTTTSADTAGDLQGSLSDEQSGNNKPSSPSTKTSKKAGKKSRRSSSAAVDSAKPSTDTGSKSDRMGDDERDTSSVARGRQLTDIKGIDEISKFASVLHGLEELLKGTEIKNELARSRSKSGANRKRGSSSKINADDDNVVDDDRPRVDIKYEPTWESVDSRPLPSWYDEAKFGIFLHWGVYSVPSVGTEWFWWNWQGSHTPSYEQFMNNNYKPNFTYADFAPQFTAEFFNATEWAELFKTAGAKYVVLTSKHHEGFTNFPSPYSFNWNSMDVGPRKDLVGELASAVKAQPDLRFGLYYSLFEWFNPMYMKDKANQFKTREYVLNKMTPELKYLVETYKPEVVWSDGDWEPDYTYWDSPGFLAWLYNESPVKDTVVVNDRWGSGMACKHGGYYTCADRFNPGTLQPHKWENCWTIDKKSWGYRRNAHIWEFCSIDELVQTLAETVSCGGNLLLNVGPSHDGTIKPIFEERLLQIGAWLKVNGEAIYGSSPWIHQNDTVVSGVWYTMKKFDEEDGGNKVYGIVLNWPDSGMLVLGSPKFCTNTTVNMLGWPDPLPWTASTRGPEIVLPPKQKVATDWGWVLVFQGLCNDE